MARNPNRGSGNRTNRDYNKKYTDKDRPSGWYQVEGKGKRWWNSYTGKWTRSPVGSTDDMIRRAHSEGKIPTATNTGSPRGGGRTTKKEDPPKPTGTTRNWRNGYGAQSDKPSSGDPSTWKKKTEVKQVASDTSDGPRRIGDNRGGGGGDRTPDRTPPRNQSGSSDSGRKPETRPSSETHKKPPTAPPPVEKKPKTRLEKALSGIGKWEEPKEKPKRNKPTSRFLKKTNNTRRKER